MLSDEPDDPIDNEVHYHLSEDQIYSSDEDAALQRISEQQSPLFQRPIEKRMRGGGGRGSAARGAGGGQRPIGLLRQDTPSPRAFTGRKNGEKKVMLNMVIDQVSQLRLRAAWRRASPVVILYWWSLHSRLLKIN